MMKLTVIGCGYLGAVHAACMAQLGHDVVGIDVDAPKVELLASGKTPFFEPGFEEVLQDALASGRLSFTSDMASARASGALRLRRHPAEAQRVRRRHGLCGCGRHRTGAVPVTR